ncbi:unnamed protein product, partial [Mycena citricolor]
PILAHGLLPLPNPLCSPQHMFLIFLGFFPGGPLRERQPPRYVAFPESAVWARATVSSRGGGPRRRCSHANPITIACPASCCPP